jgi:hypothetical protein
MGFCHVGTSLVVRLYECGPLVQVLTSCYVWFYNKTAFLLFCLFNQCYTEVHAGDEDYYAACVKNGVAIDCSVRTTTCALGTDSGPLCQCIPPLVRVSPIRCDVAGTCTTRQTCIQHAFVDNQNKLLMNIMCPGPPSSRCNLPVGHPWRYPCDLNTTQCSGYTDSRGVQYARCDCRKESAYHASPWSCTGSTPSFLSSCLTELLF